jgi:hypothetical protein
MWICLNDAYLSIVKPREEKGDNLLVRARIKGDIERVFPDAVVTKLPNRDYDFRATVPAAEVARALVDRVFNLDYPNFKGSVAEHERHEAYYGIWRVMWNLQNKLRGRSCIEFEDSIRKHHGKAFDFEG